MVVNISKRIGSTCSDPEFFSGFFSAIALIEAYLRRPFFHSSYQTISLISIHYVNNRGITDKKKEEEFLHRTFPFFIWLLRDEVPSIPRDCKDIKDYFLKKVRIQNKVETPSQKVANGRDTKAK